MSKFNMTRNGCRDVFNAFLVSEAHYSGYYEFPKLQRSCYIPNRLIPFSKALACKDYDQWIHFFEDDYQFERVWRNPRKYLPLFKRYNGVILPDFSLYRDMPMVMQLWNIYRSRALGFWLQQNGIKIIVNLRYADNRSYSLCCLGVPKHSTIAIGTHGTMKDKDDRQFFCEGLNTILKELEPSAIIVYGCAPDSIFNGCKEQGIQIFAFPSEFSSSHGEVK